MGRRRSDLEHIFQSLWQLLIGSSELLSSTRRLVSIPCGFQTTYFSYHPEILKEGGYEIELPEEAGSIAYNRLLPTSEGLGKVSTYAEKIPMEAAIDFSVAGTVDECIEKIGEYVKAGAGHIDLINLGPNPRRVMEIYGKEIIPRFKEGR